MARKSVNVIRKMYEAFHGGDVEGALERFSPDVVIDASRRPDGRVGRGREELGAIIGEWVTAFDDWREEIEELRGVGNEVLVVARQRGRGKGSGIEVEARYAVVYEVRRETITGMTLYPDPAEAREAVGPSE